MALVPEGEGYSLETILDFFGEGGLKVAGFLPLELRFDEAPDLSKPGLEIQIEGEGIPIAMAAGPTGLAEAEGTINLRGEVKGTLDVHAPNMKRAHTPITARSGRR